MKTRWLFLFIVLTISLLLPPCNAAVDLEVLQDIRSIGFIDIRDHIPDLLIGLEVLPHDIDFIIRQNTIDLC